MTKGGVENPVIFALVCDGVRQEVDGKLMFYGVYQGHMHFPDAKFPLEDGPSFSLAASLRVDLFKNDKISLIFERPDKKPFLEREIPVHRDRPITFIELALVNIRFPKKGVYSLYFKDGRKKYEGLQFEVSDQPPA